MARRRSKKGLLLGMRQAGSRSAKKRRKKTLPRRVGEWALGGIVLAGLVVVVGLMVMRMFSPSYGVRESEGSFEVARVEEYPEPVPAADEDDPPRVAEVLLRIERRDVRLALGPEQLRRVREGARIHVRYTVKPFETMAPIQVDGWDVETPDPGADTGSPDSSPD